MVNVQVSWVGILGIVLVLLRAFEVILWPWIWVLLPFWIYPAILILGVAISFVGYMYDKWQRKRALRKRKRELDKYR